MEIVGTCTANGKPQTFRIIDIMNTCGSKKERQTPKGHGVERERERERERGQGFQSYTPPTTVA